MVSDGPSPILLQIFGSDPEAANARYSELAARLRHYFLSRHREYADDLAQETLRRGLARIQAGAEIVVDPACYFFSIARNVSIEQWRAGRKQMDPLPDDPPDPRHGVDFSSVETKLYVEQCLRLLAPLEREVLSRYYSEDHEQLAAALGLSHSNLRVIAYRAKKKLTAELGKATKSGATVQQNRPPRHSRSGDR
jgi:RNA polymerase sigma factor (sigma-70 family)